MKRLLVVLAFALPTANAQVLTSAIPTASPASQVLALAPQLLAFAGDANFTNLVNGLALGQPVTLSTSLANGGTQAFTFTPSGTMTVLEIAQTLEKARQLLISRGVATPTAQQLGTALTGGSLTTASGTTNTTPMIATTLNNSATGGSSAAVSATTKSPASAVQLQTSAPAANAAAGSTASGVRNLSDSPFPRGISDSPPQAIPGVSEPAPGSATIGAPAGATPATTAAATVAPAATAPASITAAPGALRVR